MRASPPQHTKTSQNTRLAANVKELNAKYKAELAAQKARARDSQMTRREQELDDRRTQTAALVTALNAVVRVIERLEPKSEKNEREKEGIYCIATSNDVL